MWGGVEYVTSESFVGKSDGRDKIARALGALIILFVSFIFLEDINPELTKVRFNILSLEGTVANPSFSDVIGGNDINSEVDKIKEKYWYTDTDSCYQTKQECDAAIANIKAHHVQEVYEKGCFSYYRNPVTGALVATWQIINTGEVSGKYCFLKRWKGKYDEIPDEIVNLRAGPNKDLNKATAQYFNCYDTNEWFNNLEQACKENDQGERIQIDPKNFNEVKKACERHLSNIGSDTTFTSEAECFCSQPTSDPNYTHVECKYFIDNTS